eukprot:6481545-Amphidinium_carterae.2
MPCSLCTSSSSKCVFPESNTALCTTHAPFSSFAGGTLIVPLRASYCSPHAKHCSLYCPSNLSFFAFRESLPSSRCMPST